MAQGARIRHDHLSLILTITCEPITHTIPQWTFIKTYKDDWASFKEDIQLKTEETNVHHAKNSLRKAINAAAGRHIPQGRLKRVVANLASEAVKVSEEKDETQRKHPRDPNITQLNHEINKFVQIQKRTTWIEFLQTYVERLALVLWTFMLATDDPGTTMKLLKIVLYSWQPSPSNLANLHISALVHEVLQNLWAFA